MTLATMAVVSASLPSRATNFRSILRTTARAGPTGASR
jgi:hypothetical protein